MSEDTFDVLINNLKRGREENTISNLIKLRDNLSDLNDFQQLIFLQQLSILFRNIKLRGNESKIASEISFTIEVIAENISDEFLLHAFGGNPTPAMNPPLNLKC